MCSGGLLLNLVCALALRKYFLLKITIAVCFVFCAVFAWKQFIVHVFTVAKLVLTRITVVSLFLTLGWFMKRTCICDSNGINFQRIRLTSLCSTFIMEWWIYCVSCVLFCFCFALHLRLRNIHRNITCLITASVSIPRLNYTSFDKRISFVWARPVGSTRIKPRENPFE